MTSYRIGSSAISLDCHLNYFHEDIGQEKYPSRSDRNSKGDHRPRPNSTNELPKWRSALQFRRVVTSRHQANIFFTITVPLGATLPPRSRSAQILCSLRLLRHAGDQINLCQTSFADRIFWAIGPSPSSLIARGVAATTPIQPAAPHQNLFRQLCEVGKPHDNQRRRARLSEIRPGV